MPTPQIKAITSEQTRPLRHEILRPNQKYEMTTYPHDDSPTSHHFGCIIDDEIVGIISLYNQSRDGGIDQGHWRIRGMAVKKELQGKGLGALLLEKGLSYAKENGALSIWCNARTTALGFYERVGMKKASEEFEIEGIGPHFVFEMKL